MPSERASASIAGVRNVWFGAQILPPAAWTARGTEPPCCSGAKPASHGDGLPSAGASVRGEVRYIVRISGASFWTTCSVRQSNDWIMRRRSIPPLRISAITRRANSSGGSVAAGSSGEILVSQSKPIFVVARLLHQVEEVGQAGNARAVDRLLVGEALRVVGAGLEPTDVVALQFVEGEGADVGAAACPATCRPGRGWCPD